MSSQEPPHSVAKVVMIPELLSNIGSQITNKKALYNLCLTSKAFNQAFSPFLYAAVTVDEPKWDTRFATGPRTAWFGSIRSLCIIAPHSDTTVSKINAANATARAIFQLAHGLEEFRIVRYPLVKRTISTLFENCRKLSTVSITFPRHNRSPDSVVDTHGVDVELTTGLSNLGSLKRLTLKELDGDIRSWRRQIVDVLCHSPGLEHLSLSLSPRPLERIYWDEQARGVDSSIRSYFDELCLAYGERAQNPLRLKSLKCGTAVLPFSAGALRELTDLSTLEAVYINNMDLRCHGADVLVLYCDEEDSGIAWEAFGPNSAPNLRRFSAYECRGDVRDFLVSEWSASGSQLALSFPSNIFHNWDEDGILGSLWEISPRMYDLELRNRLSALEAANIPAETILADGEWVYIAVERLLEIVVAHGRDTLEGLNIYMECRGDENGENRELFLHWAPLLGAVKRLAHLGQLEVNACVEGYGISKEEEQAILKRAAEELAMAAPALCYVGVVGRYWQVIRRDGKVVELQELDDAEKRQVELFTLAPRLEMEADLF